MSGLNVALINNRLDALSYITPISDAEVVLYDLLNDAQFDADATENLIENLNDEISDLEYKNGLLKDFFDKVCEAYNKKQGFVGGYEIDDKFVADEIIEMLTQAE